jgi:hypothetical protein
LKRLFKIPDWLYELAIKIADRYDQEHSEEHDEEYDEDYFNSLLNAGEDDRGNPIF